DRDSIRYFVPSGPPSYADLRRPSNAHVTVVNAVIMSYSIVDEKSTNTPVAVIFVRESGELNLSAVFLAHPLSINGSRFECVPKTHASQFVRKYHLCSALPQAVIGSSRRVALS